MPNRNHGFANEPYFMRRTWDYFVEHLRGGMDVRVPDEVCNLVVGIPRQLDQLAPVHRRVDVGRRTVESQTEVLRDPVLLDHRVPRATQRGLARLGHRCARTGQQDADNNWNDPPHTPSPVPENAARCQHVPPWRGHGRQA
jgi:hypothetical protein